MNNRAKRPFRLKIGKCNLSKDTLVIPLPSLVHRIGRDDVVVARQCATLKGCELSRIRRSRNWQIKGKLSALSDFLEHLKKQDYHRWRFIIDKISPRLSDAIALYESPVDKLHRLLDTSPHLTITELAEQTGLSDIDIRRERISRGE